MVSLRRLAAMVVIFGVACGCGGGGQGSPAETLQAAYERVAEGNFAEACELVEPQLREALGTFGGCQAALASEFTVEQREALSDVTIDERLIEVNGDTASVSEGAVTAGGESLDDFETLVSHDGRWWIAG